MHMCIQLLPRDHTSEVAQVWAGELKYYLVPVGEQGLHHKRLVTSDYQRWFKHSLLLSCRCCALGPGWASRTSSSAAWHVERLGAWTRRDELLASRWDAGGCWNLARGITDKIDEVWRCNKKQDMLTCCSQSNVVPCWISNQACNRHRPWRPSWSCWICRSQPERPSRYQARTVQLLAESTVQNRHSKAKLGKETCQIWVWKNGWNWCLSC